MNCNQVNFAKVLNVWTEVMHKCFFLTVSENSHSNWHICAWLLWLMGGRCRISAQRSHLFFTIVRVCCFEQNMATDAIFYFQFDFSAAPHGFTWSPDVGLIFHLSFSQLVLFSPIQDQFDNLEKHTQWGIEYLEKYTKFVKERSEIEINYAKQIRWVLPMHCGTFSGLWIDMGEKLLSTLVGLMTPAQAGLWPTNVSLKRATESSLRRWLLTSLWRLN